MAGQVRQACDSSDYLFRLPQVLEHLSKGITFEPGDAISLGTLGGSPGLPSSARRAGS